MADVELKRREFSSSEEIPAPDGLLIGLNQSSPIKITGPAELVRGELLMSNDDGDFVSATKAGLSSAKEICILAEDVVISSDEYTESVGYFTGGFAKNAVIFSWEDESSNHLDEAAGLKAILRGHNIFLY